MSLIYLKPEHIHQRNIWTLECEKKRTSVLTRKFSREKISHLYVIDGTLLLVKPYILCTLFPTLLYSGSYPSTLPSSVIFRLLFQSLIVESPLSKIVYIEVTGLIFVVISYARNFINWQIFNWIKLIYFTFIFLLHISQLLTTRYSTWLSMWVAVARESFHFHHILLI